MNSAAASPLIEVVGLEKHFDDGLVRALDRVDLVVEAGEFVAIAGPSGCGKSTLLHLLGALDRPTAGTMVVNGQDLTQRRDLDRYRRLEIGLVFQLHNLLPRLSALENVEIPMLGTPGTRQDHRERARDLLAEMGLAGKEHRQPTRLSGGERQRVALARALANLPPLLLADEPTGSLDTEAAAHVVDLLAQARRDRGLTIVMVTHDPTVAAAADRVVHMQDGRVVANL